MTAGECVAQVAHELLDPGPMGWEVRREDYKEFCARNFIDGTSAGVFGSGGTNCALFARGCCVQADVMPRAGRPKVPAITTWLGMNFSGPAWLRFDGTGLVLSVGTLTKTKTYGTPEPGDIFYICSNAGQMMVAGKLHKWTNWHGALNGHVGVVLFDGAGWLHQTAEGGGARHLCRKSAEPKDLRKMGRTLQGVWRPSFLVQPGEAA